MTIHEPLPYRFDGTRNEHDFAADLFAAATFADHAAGRRIEMFMRQAFADVSTGDVNELNPATPRPDLYAPAPARHSPIWSAIVKDPRLSGPNGFTMPSFDSVSDLVADHEEGVEPTGGTYTTTGGTITPTPISGKVDLTRETFDQGQNNPWASAAIWIELLHKWNEALEARAVALLESLTPQPISLTAGATGATLADALDAELSALDLLAGGAGMTGLFVHGDLWQILAAARTTTDEPLLPRTPDGGMRIGFRTARPAWALPTSATETNSSYLFNPADVHGWATAPQRLELQCSARFVTVAIWGYAATTCTRLAGCREITYDPQA